MALIKCPDCGADVSDIAPACPHCGRPIAAPPAPPAPVKPVAAAKAPKQASGCGTLVVLVLLGLFIYGMVSHSDDKPKDKPASTEAADTKATEDCRKDLKCIGEKHIVAASVYCKDMIDAQAAHDTKWSDGMLDPSMSRYRWTDKPGGRVTFIGDKVSFQNGFGAFTPMTYMCDFDVDSDKPIKVTVIEGRLPR